MASEFGREYFHQHGKATIFSNLQDLQKQTLEIILMGIANKVSCMDYDGRVNSLFYYILEKNRPFKGMSSKEWESERETLKEANELVRSLDAFNDLKSVFLDSNKSYKEKGVVFYQGGATELLCILRNGYKKRSNLINCGIWSSLYTQRFSRRFEFDETGSIRGIYISDLPGFRFTSFNKKIKPEKKGLNASKILLECYYNGLDNIPDEFKEVREYVAK